MNSQSVNPLFSFHPCDWHVTAETVTVTSGPDSTEADKDLIMEVITCQECWDRNPVTMEKVCETLGITGNDLVVLKRNRR